MQAQRQKRGGRGLRTLALGQGLVISGRGCFKGRRGRRDETGSGHAAVGSGSKAGPAGNLRVGDAARFWISSWAPSYKITELMYNPHVEISFHLKQVHLKLLQVWLWVSVMFSMATDGPK